MRQINETINYFRDAQEELAEAREQVIKLAISLGADEKAINQDARCARFFLEGYKKGLVRQ